MGKKLYTKENISKSETERLGIPELVVLKTNSDDASLEVVHRRYFEEEKLFCGLMATTRSLKSSIYFIISAICVVITADKAFSLSL